MSEKEASVSELQSEIEILRNRLAEAEEFMRAIRLGEVDALVVSGEKGDQVFSLEGADHAYRVLVEGMKEGAVTVAEDGTILYCNRSFAEMVKAPLEKVIGKSIQSFVVSADLDAFNALLRGSGRGEVNLRAEDKSFLPAFLSVSPLKIEGSQDICCLLVTDLREQKRSEEIVASEKLARAIIEQAAEAIVVCDGEGKIIRFSNTASRICCQDLMNSHFHEVFDLRAPAGDNSEEMVSPVKDALDGNVLLRVEAQYKREDGRLFHLMLNAGPLKNAEGEVIGCVVTLTDISNCKRVEKDLREAHEYLEKRVQERTQELQNAKEELECINEELRIEIGEHEKTEIELLKAKDAAEDAVRIKAEFMANMSHELRTPMNAVLGMAGILLDEELNPEHREFVEIIHNSGNALLTVINDILDFSRMEREKLELEYQPFDPRNLIEEALDLVASDAGSKNLDLACIIESAPDAIISDPARLRQVLVNLLGNAVKFTQEGEVVVFVSSRLIDSGYEIHFTVRDTGIGISPEKFDLIFQPFSQADSSTTRDYGGTGLGLSISKKLVERLGGRIWVESRVGEGSEFHFTITASAVLGALKPKDEAPELAGKRILIVDDNRTIRRLISRQAYSWGMVPTVTASPIDALKWIRRGDTFDLALIDANIPEMYGDGNSLAEQIRKYNSVLPLIMMALVGAPRPKGTYAALITKPIKHSSLLCVLKDVLSKPAADERIRKGKSQGSRDDSKSSASSPRIIVAEDNVSSQKVTLQMLRKLGYRADVAASGQEVLEALERQPYDIVLMDVRMPDMDGLEATRAIRDGWPPEDQPCIIAVTAYALEGDREKCLEAGMDDYISKPLTFKELQSIMDKHVTGK